MKKLPLLLLPLCILSAGAACKPKAKPVRAMSLDEAIGMSRNDFAVIFDVRSEAQAQAQDQSKPVLLPPGTQRVALDAIQAGDATAREAISKVKSEQMLILCCGRGAEIEKAAENLAAQGVSVGRIE